MILLMANLLAANENHPWVEASISAAAAGTFLFFGTLHGLATSPMNHRCRWRHAVINPFLICYGAVA
tara:strand:- start:421 stop:621 length:201 start_codon:yes stop_codon:yes gene_type:complete